MTAALATVGEGTVASVDDSGAIVFLNPTQFGGIALATGTTNDVLASTGFTSGQVFEAVVPPPATMGSCLVLLDITRGLFLPPS